MASIAKVQNVVKIHMFNAIMFNRVQSQKNLLERGSRLFHGSATQQKNIRSGVPKITVTRDKPLTYEEANPPYQIGVRKSWNSWNTNNLHENVRTAETTFEDAFIRKFMYGTWHKLFVSEIIIKRKYNMITLTGLVYPNVSARTIYFLIGYAEDMLSYILKAPVKIDIQTVKSRKDVVFKYI